MSIITFISIFFLLQGICVWVGSRVSKKMETQEDYFLAGRSVRFFPLLMTFIATQIGGGLILGSCEEAYRYGWIVILYPLGATLGFLLLAMGVGKRMGRFNVGTIAQLFEVVYGSIRLKKVASSLSIASLFFILVAQFIASKKFLLSLGVDAQWIFLGFWGLVILYTVMGGLKAVVATDIIQALFFLVVFFGGFLVTFLSGGLSFEAASLSSEPFLMEGSKLTGWLLMPLLFMVIEQDMGQRCFAASSPKTVTKASALAALITFSTACIPILYGVLGKLKGIVVPEGSSSFMEIVSQTTAPWITSLMGCAILAAIISTADSLMNAISSNLVLDFNFKVRSIKKSQLLTAGIALLGMGVSYLFTSIVDMLIFSYELSVSALFVPVFMALFIQKGNKLSAYVAILLGGSSFVISRFVTYPFPHEIVSVLCSAGGFAVGEGLARVRVQSKI